MLTPLQQRIARLVASLPEAEGFALAGAGALVVHGYIDRQTRDLDYFTTPARQAQVQRLGAALERALAENAIESQRIRDLPTFVRLVVGREPDRCEVDVAIDYRALQPERTALGPTLAPKELAANRVLAIFDRAEPRDFTDLDAVIRIFLLADLVELAERKDTGFDRPRFMQALASFHRLTPEDPRIDPDAHRRLARVVDGWRRQIERSVERDTGLGHDGPGLETPLSGASTPALWARSKAFDADYGEARGRSTELVQLCVPDYPVTCRVGAGRLDCAVRTGAYGASLPP